jgi:hypothetical protein
MIVANVSRSPSTHVQFWFRSRRSKDDDLSPIVQLVCSAADRFGSEWDALLLDENKYDGWEDLISSLSEDEDAIPNVCIGQL